MVAARAESLFASPDAAARFQDEIQREMARRGLLGFMQSAWPLLEPRSRPLIKSWALGAICEHLEAVTHGQLTRLLMTVPPGMTKSMSTRVFWPMWEWGPQDMAHLRTVGASYHGNLAIRDNRRARMVMESEWFQRLWPHVQMSHDQRGNMRFSNTDNGFMLATSVQGMGTGERGDRFIIDDPHNVKQGESKAYREQTTQWFREVVPTRLNDSETSAIVCIMQRVAQGDVADHARELGYEHLMLPMEFEESRRCTTSIGFTDPRTEEGELLAPDRFSRRAVDELQNSLGDYGTAAQLQQRPAPRGGGMFPVDRFEIIPHAPMRKDVQASIRYWDKAGTTDSGDWTVGLLMHRMRDGTYIIEDVVRGQWGALDRERRIRQTAEADGHRVRIWVEQEPGSSGKESAEATIRRLAGYRAQADKVTGAKEERAEPFAAQVQAGNVYLVEGEWIGKYKGELEVFPNGMHDDQVDASSGAFNKLSGAGANIRAML